MILRKIGLGNVRCFRKDASFSIKPITVLVGKNSSGKSTLARLFPLARQSFEKSTKGPVLWYGEYVDFGSIATTRSSGSESEDITLYFEFGLNQESLFFRHSSFMSPLDKNIRILEPTSFKLKVKIAHSSSYQQSFCKSYELRFADNKIKVEFEDPDWVSSVEINESREEFGEESLRMFRSGDSFLPELSYAIWDKADGDESNYEWKYHEPKLNESLQAYVKRKTHEGLSTEKVAFLLSQFGIAKDSTLKKKFKEIDFDSVTLNDYSIQLAQDPKEFNYLKSEHLRIYLSSLTRSINNTLASEFAKVKYLAPVRAKTQRYYREQEVSVAEIDAEGANIAMYIDSLKPQDRIQLNTFLHENLGIEVFCTKTTGHLALNIRERENAPIFNIADMGFGYSQVLPIMVQAWASQHTQLSPSRARQNRDTILVIEQPELHLHPEFQARLSNVFSEFVTNIRNSSVVLETHSPHIINRLGELVATQVIKPSEINIVLVENRGGSSELKETTFDREGVLKNWPFGFFEPS